jgi:hypothetical protein
MRRRRILQLLAAAAGTVPFRSWQAWAQTVTFPGNQASTLEAVALVTLPASLGREAMRAEAKSFEKWVQDYRPGADTDHGYGHTRVVPLPASPAPLYLEQLAALKPELASGDRERARAAVITSMEKAGIKDLAPYGRGRHVAADLMSHYFLSDAANDLCYEAAIQRHECRGLKNSDLPPLPLRKQA